MFDWQLFAVGLIVLLAFIPLVRHRSRNSIARGRGWVLVLPFGVVAVPILMALAWSKWIVTDDLPLEQFLPRPVSGEGFVSSNSCRSCHPQQYASWHASYHRTMTQPARHDTVFAPFDKVTLESGGRTFHLERRGDEFWVDMVDPIWDFKKLESTTAAAQSSVPPRVQKRIVMTTGSHHFQIYWTRNSRGVYFQLPWVYYIKQRQWIPWVDSFLRPPDAPSGTVPIWNGTCIKCHAVGGQPGIDARLTRFDTQVGELGIACEACHGPGEEHVRINGNPLRRYKFHVSKKKMADATIVNPARSDSRVASQICGQCHRAFIEKNVPRFMKRGDSYRAGDDLEQTRPTVRYSEESDPSDQPGTERDPNTLQNIFWRDGTIRVGGREYNGLIESPCYQRGVLSCLSCHSIHQSDPNNQLASGMDTNSACLQCHKTFRERLEEHTHHPANSKGSLCYNCHMPHTTYALFTATRSHRIDSPNIQTAVRSGRPNACNLCHLDKTLAWTSEHLSQWYGQPAVELEDDEQQIAASLLWLLRGDAAQRVITAWHMGWESAHEASGVQWLAPFLVLLLEDPYSAVRCVTYNSLRQIPEYADFAYDFVGPEGQRSDAKQRALQIWDRMRSQATIPSAPQIPLSANGTIQREVVDRLLSKRDNRPVEISE